jgi:heme/copper-type cytochrome/quinol oxidase subunit 2
MSRLSLKILFATLVAGKRILGLLKVVRQVGRNKFWGTFRILMLAGPIVIPVLSSIKRFMRKPA